MLHKANLKRLFPSYTMFDYCINNEDRKKEFGISDINIGANTPWSILEMPLDLVIYLAYQPNSYACMSVSYSSVWVYPAHVSPMALHMLYWGTFIPLQEVHRSDASLHLAPVLGN